MRKIFGFILLMTFFLLYQLSCSRMNDALEVKPPANVDELELVDVSYNDLPYISNKLASLATYPQDSAGVLIFEYNGKKYYHPVQLCQNILFYIDSYHKSGIEEYLRRAKLFTNKLKDISQVYHGAIYYPYKFEYSPHSIAEETLTVPWYSGMAQGQALSVMVRMFEITHNQIYLEYAKKTYESFKLALGDYSPWVIMIDDEGYFWIEEYPLDSGPTHVLNGMIWAIYGLYDYWALTKDAECEFWLRAALTTIKKYISQYRNENTLSYYCLKHKKQYEFYHKIHTEQLYQLFKLTKDYYFLEMQGLFYSDFH